MGSSSPKIRSMTVARDPDADALTVVGASAMSQMKTRSADTTYLPGEVIADRYRLIRELGRGGMGVVWEARSLALEVNVALKLMKSGADSEAASRMAREAHAAARLAHPALVRVFDFGWSSRGNPFLVMELVTGETLASIIAAGCIAPIRAVQMLLPIADGLRSAHEKGIVHRDIKPANVLIATDPFGRSQPKLLDFGIARLKQLPTDHRLTVAGTVMGSPAYMSPEQARGDEDVDERSDIWSLCVVLYEMISGDVPFHHANYNALMQAILHQEPRTTVSLGAGDAELWQIIARGLSKDHAARWPSITELGTALATWLYQHGIKEDLCGNSLRALWLDPSQGARPDSAAPLKRLTSPPQSQIMTRVRVPEAGWRSKRRLLVLAGLLGMSATVTLLWLRSGESELRAELESPPSLRTAQSPPVVAKAVPPAEPQPPSGLSAEPLASARQEAPPLPASEPQPSTRPVRPDAATPPRRDKKKTIRDFGF